ncbi:MAG: tRNA lysidine(34) synthetase TilS [Hydrogenovibrio sp.]|nr:tRNA lysidine(34) synthetase TilS [Hydrogenovibrio sp.]
MSSLSVEEAIVAFLKDANDAQKIIVAFSGGMDSVVLLHALLQQTDASRLKAVHVHHGLQTEADDWQAFCEAFAAQRHLPFECIPIQLSETRRQGVEGAARHARYRALYQVLSEGSVLVTAHHQRDQAETLLLNLFRGTGLGGMAGMPYHKPLSLANSTRSCHYRPLLKVSFEQMQAYAERHALDWVEDPSNQDVYFKRNLIRHQVLPMIQQAWPGVESRISDAAENLGESLALLDELAASDIVGCHPTAFSLDLAGVQMLSWQRQKNLLRYWAREYVRNFQLSQMLYDWLNASLLNKNPEAHAKWQLSNAALRVESKKVYYLADFKQEFEVLWHDVDLEELHFDEARIMTHQVNAKWFESPHQVMLRSLKESDLQVFPGLKKWLKQQSVVFWNRTRWPVMEIDGQVAAVLGFATRFEFQ